ncbi:histidinol phosphate phosphatase [Clostridium thailandense]|uniref:Histidinol-phosphatase n=1 Tax=Clostridium thailandense TaxID=2794346 RepID=A0A949WTU6_9CLOT|nr:histidinol phosphate phosphatase [Clostridium thailandense]MBV7271882.1 histidinol phosphate phosphatase [Clostridium thailandense]MCH5137108.1 histidinol phosphate phosphatase [Clostridiaceae bacterium UIB06]
MFDTHVHTKISTDSNMDIEEAIKSAQNKNISMIITEHMDLKFPKEGMFCFDSNNYFEEYSKHRGKNLLLGVEIGMKEDCVEESRELLNDNPFDYAIGSIHLVDNMDIYYSDFYKNKSKREAYEEYLNFMLKCIKNYDFIDSMGHIDYISRYANFEDKEMYYHDFSDIIDEILQVLIEKDKCIELNTRRLDDEKAAKNLINIYRRFRELGGKNITIGSDAHNTETLGCNFNVAREISELCDLRVVYFKERNKEYERI